MAVEKGEEVTDTSKDAADDVRALIDSSRKLRSTLSDTAKDVQQTTENFVADVSDKLKSFKKNSKIQQLT